MILLISSGYGWQESQSATPVWTGKVCCTGVEDHDDNHAESIISHGKEEQIVDGRVAVAEDHAA